MGKGWIKLHRKFLDWEWYTDVPTKTLFIHLLLEANHEPQKWKGIDVEKGQCVVGRKELSQKTGLSEQQIRTALDKLKQTGEISAEPTNKFTVITVHNYALYQSSDDGKQPTNNQQVTINQPTNNQQITTNKNDKNEKNDKKVRNIFRKPSVEEIRSYISEHGLNVDADYFYDYYESNGWTVGKSHMKSWQSTLNNWNRREKKKPSDHVVIDKPSYMGTGYDPEAFKW